MSSQYPNHICLMDEQKLQIEELQIKLRAQSKQCLLCNSYIKEIKRMSENASLQNERNRGLQRQIDAFKEFLASKGIMLNEGEEKEMLEMSLLVDDGNLWGRGIPAILNDDEWRKESKPDLSVEGQKELQKILAELPHKIDENDTSIDDYDYAADDMNFDAARERRMK